MALLQSKEGVVEDTHANQINTITIELSQLGKPFVSSCNINDKNVWIFYFGATDNVSCSLNNFLSYKVVKSILVHLPNNANVTTTHVGRVKLNEKLILNYVLYIPTFEYNLISISKLVSALNI